MQEPEEVKKLIVRIEAERKVLLLDYQKVENTAHLDVIAATLVEKAISVRYLRWVIGEASLI